LINFYPAGSLVSNASDMSGNMAICSPSNSASI